MSRLGILPVDGLGQLYAVHGGVVLQRDRSVGRVGRMFGRLLLPGGLEQCDPVCHQRGLILDRRLQRRDCVSGRVVLRDRRAKRRFGPVCRRLRVSGALDQLDAAAMSAGLLLRVRRRHGVRALHGSVRGRLLVCGRRVGGHGQRRMSRGPLLPGRRCRDCDVRDRLVCARRPQARGVQMRGNTAPYCSITHSFSAIHTR